MATNEYSMSISWIDTAVGLECEADRAEKEGFAGVAERQRAAALHLRNAADFMRGMCPDGHRVQTRIVIDYVPDVNPVLNTAR